VSDTEQIQAWTGDFGKAYLERNSDVSEDDMGPRTAALASVLAACPDEPQSILEVGPNIGRNLIALARLTNGTLHAVEPFTEAHDQLKSRMGERLSSIYCCAGQSLPYEDNEIDFVFTSGVLIHVSPSDLDAVIDEVYRVSSRYIWCNEYFAQSPENISYRGHDNLLFKRDFGRLYLERHPDLQPIATGFMWSATTPYDDTVWWLFKKS